jgi:hypothetical protein
MGTNAVWAGPAWQVFGWPSCRANLLPSRIFSFGWDVVPLIYRTVYCLGWRYVGFGASVTVLDGRVSSIAYNIEPDFFMGWPQSYLVSVRSAHGFWARAPRFGVKSFQDQNLAYWVRGNEDSITALYMVDAPPQLISDAFQLDLTCFWGLHGCDSARQIAPLLWKHKAANEAADALRLRSQNPCPDSMLAARVRYLLDLSVVLLEVVSSREEDINSEGGHRLGLVTDYRLKEVIRGRGVGPYTGIHCQSLIPAPLSSRDSMANPAASLLKPGDRMLYFTGADFDSCSMVPATPSAELAVRTTIPAPRRGEDDALLWTGPMM